MQRLFLKRGLIVMKIEIEQIFEMEAPDYLLRHLFTPLKKGVESRCDLFNTLHKSVILSTNFQFDDKRLFTGTLAALILAGNSTKKTRYPVHEENMLPILIHSTCARTPSSLFFFFVSSEMKNHYTCSGTTILYVSSVFPNQALQCKERRKWVSIMPKKID